MILETARRRWKRIARFEEGVADRIARVPGDTCDAALQGALAIVEADRAEVLRLDHCPHRRSTADGAHQLVVSGVVAFGNLPQHQVAKRRREAPGLQHFLGDRLVKQREVVPGEGHRVGERHLSLVHCVHGGDRDPQFAHALLRIKLVGLPPGRPAVVDRFDGNPDLSVKATAEFAHAVADVLRRRRSLRFLCGLRMGGTRRARDRDDVLAAR